MKITHYHSSFNVAAKQGWITIFWKNSPTTFAHKKFGSLSMQNFAILLNMLNTQGNIEWDGVNINIKEPT